MGVFLIFLSIVGDPDVKYKKFGIAPQACWGITLAYEIVHYRFFKKFWYKFWACFVKIKEAKDKKSQDYYEHVRKWNYDYDTVNPLTRKHGQLRLNKIAIEWEKKKGKTDAKSK